MIFAKGPRLGAGKTRLARAIGQAQALRINRFLQARTLRAAQDPRWETMLLVGARRDLAAAFPGVWPAPARLPRKPQAPGDLGARLAAAFASRRPVAVIGSDCPELTPAAIARGFQALRRAPFVLGPAPDGGFWLFAARRGSTAQSAFTGVRWSSEHAAADLAARLPARLARINTLADIDEWEDWRAYRQRKRQSRPE